MVSYSDVVKGVKTPSQSSQWPSLASTGGRPRTECDWCSFEKVNEYVSKIPNFDVYVSKKGARPVSREILVALAKDATTPFDSYPALKQKQHLQRVRNWLAKSLKGSSKQSRSMNEGSARSESLNSATPKPKSGPGLTSNAPQKAFFSSTPVLGGPTLDCSGTSTIDLCPAASAPSIDEHPLIGMINQNITCYMISTLQVLYASKIIVSLIRHHQCYEKGCISCALKNLYTKLSQSKEPLDPADFRSLLPTISSSFILDIPQDAHEFFMFLMTRIGVQTRHGKSASLPALFLGWQDDIVKCHRCKTEVRNADEFTSLSVTCHESIQQSLDKYFLASEVLDDSNAYFCSVCNSKCRASKCVELVQAPSVLCVALKRFAVGGVKSDDSLLALNRKIHLREKTYGNFQTAHYSLKGDVCHLGQSIWDGHYVSRVCGEGKRAFYLNDAKVTEIEKYPEYSSSTHFLIYERIPQDTNDKQLLHPIEAIEKDTSFTTPAPKRRQKSLSLKKQKTAVEIIMRPPYLNGADATKEETTPAFINKTSTKTQQNVEKEMKSPFSFHDLNTIKSASTKVKKEDEAPLPNKGRKSKQIEMTNILKAIDLELEETKRSQHDMNRKQSIVPKEEEMVDDPEYNPSEHSDDSMSVDGVTRKKHPGYSKMSYHNFEGKFFIKGEIWDSVWDWEKRTFKCRRQWVLIFKEYIKKFRPRCKHSFQCSGLLYVDVSGDVRMHAYVRCGTGKCKHYAFEWIPEKGKDLVITVHSAGEENHDKALTKTTQVRGAERELTKNILRNTKAHKHKLNVITELEPKIVAENNWQNLKSNEVFRKIRSEALQDSDLHKDDFIDVVLMRRKELELPPERRYIQSASEPLIVHLFSESVLKIVFDYFKRKTRMTVHLDATGKFIRSHIFYGNTIYLYSCVVQINEIQLQIFSMISCKHDQVAIGSILGNFRNFCENELRKVWPCIGRVVTDCSFAIIQAIMRQWNGTSLDKYLQACYKFCSGQFSANDLSKLVLVRLCKNHWTKMVCSNLKGHLIKGKLKCLIVEVIMKLMTCENMTEFDSIFTEFAIILNSKTKNLRIVEAFKTLAIKPNNIPNDIVEPDVVNISELLDEHAFETNGTLYDTAFHQHCLKINFTVENLIQIEENREEKEEEEEEEQEEHEEEIAEATKLKDYKNPFHCPDFFASIFFKNHYAALIPLWTCIMDNIRNEKKTFTASNAPVEGLFNIKKNIEHDEMHDKPGRFIQIDKKYTLAAAKAVFLKIRTDGNVFEEEDETEQAVDENNQSRISNECVNIDYINPNASKEKWKGTSEVKFNYSQGKTIKRVASILESPVPGKVFRNDTFITPTRSAAKKILELSKRRKKKIKGRTLSQTLGDCELWQRKTPKGNKPSLSCNTSRVITTSQLADAANDLESSTKGAEVSVLSGIDASIQSSRGTCSSTHYRHYIPQSEHEKECAHFDFQDSLFRSIPTEYRKFIHTRLSDPDSMLYTFEDDRPVYSSDLSQLFSRKPLQSTIIDACLFIVRQEFAPKSVFVGTHTDGTQIFEETFSPDMEINNKSIYTFDSVLIPHATPGHWSLIFVNMKLGTLSLLDPGGTSKEEQRKLCRSFNNYLAELSKLKKIKLKFDYKVKQYVKFPQQSDDYNCGVYVMHYIESILRCGKCCAFDEIEYRIELGIRIIKAALHSDFRETRRCLLNKSAHGNGLIKDPQYYSSSEEVIAVCIYGQGFAPVNSDDMSALLNNKWITNWIINPAIFAFMQDAESEKFIFVRSDHALDAITTNIKPNHILCNINFEEKTIIMPINTSHVHWCLIVADCKKKMYQYLDPQNLKHTGRYMKEFLVLLNKNKHFNLQNTQNWKISQPPALPLQQDSTNCGPFVVLYAAVIMNVMRFDSNFDIVKFRTEIARKVLEKCPPMQHLCLKCGKDEYRIVDNSIGVMIQCDACLRWLHLRCSSSKVTSEDDEFYCRLCKNYKQLL